jgi:hypothetical protein
MIRYEFNQLPSNSAVSSVVTVLVSAWFLLAGGAILSDQHSQHNVEMARTPSMASTVVPDAHFTIVVEARRNAT